MESKWNMKAAAITNDLQIRPLLDALGVEAKTERPSRERIDRIKEELERAEVTTQTQKRFKREVLDALPVHMAVIDREGTIVAVNEAWVRFGRENSNLDAGRISVGANYMEVCRIAATAYVPEAMAAMRGIEGVLSGAQSQFALVYPCDSPRESRWFLMNVLPLPGETGGAVITHLNITESEQHERSLRESEERLRRLVGLMPSAVYTCDAGGIITYYNERAPEIWGWFPKIGDPIQRFCGAFKLWWPDGRALAHDQTPMAVALRDGVSVRNGEIVMEQPDGRRINVLVNIDPIRDAKGGVAGAINVFLDVTPLKQAEMEMRKAKEAAEAANRAKDQFLAVLSHELRTPLTPVLATIALLESDPEHMGVCREEIALIHRNVEMEARLIDDLLDVTRISRGKIELHHEVVDIHASLHQALEIGRAEIQAKRLEVSLGLWAERHAVWADPGRTQQVFWNLLNNAVKFTPEGGRISLRTSNVEEERLRIEISDSGVGIEAEVLPRLFNAFEQGEKSMTRRFGGLGLGLTISKAIVDLHGGRLAASSEGKGKGATFAVELRTVNTPPNRATGTVAAKRAGGKAATVLYVEDHEDTRRTMARLLRGMGYDVKTAGSVREAMEVMEGNEIKVLVSDLSLPDGSGNEIMRQVKDRYGIKGVALSGFGMEEDVESSGKAGFSRHLTKPVNVPTLEEAIRELVGG